MTACVRYYEGATPDHRGRYVSEIQTWDDQRLESVHDFIQWMFPLPEPSPVNPRAPVVIHLCEEQFRARPELRATLRKSMRRMLRFYGFVLEEEGGEWRVERAGDFAFRTSVWLWPGNHNHLRITRILRSTRLLGLEAESRAFYAALEELYREGKQKGKERITEETMGYWKRAVEGED